MKKKSELKGMCFLTCNGMIGLVDEIGFNLRWDVVEPLFKRDLREVNPYSISFGDFNLDRKYFDILISFVYVLSNGLFDKNVACLKVKHKQTNDENFCIRIMNTENQKIYLLLACVVDNQKK